MIKEIKMLKDNDIDISGLKLASTAHVTMPYHRLLDMAMEVININPSTQYFLFQNYLNGVE